MESGASICYVKMLMDHTTVTTTEIYAHLKPQKLHATVGLLGRKSRQGGAKVAQFDIYRNRGK